ncbi:hypothetical protein [Hymenobacter fodinae]|uniref:Uncharacterized protein n=1 Tax=Hymenobacter fodinae TaxID=2510796 RepID=A0A4Z0NYW2_9BACT|nr:hypothetical protein [Hymenobacter fodinae]TGE03840.1 hypothetical protein EU556_24855 [Hymenobacter fodinae]
MALSLQADAFIDTIKLPDSNHRLVRARGGDIPQSSEVSGIEVRLSQVLIKDNGTETIWPFPGYADVYVLIVVLDNLTKEPQTLTLQGFAGVDDHESLPVDRTAYFWKKETDSSPAPSQIHVLLSVLKSKNKLRNTGKVLAHVKENPEYTSLIAQIGKAVAGPTGVAVDLLLQVGTVVGSILERVEDKPLFTQVISFTDLNGNFDSLGKTTHSQQNNNVETVLTLTIRDRKREAMMAKSVNEVTASA